MVNILIKTDSHYRVNRARIRKIVEKVLEEKKAKGDIELGFSIVGDRMMKKLNQKYRNLEETTDVLAFPMLEDKSFGEKNPPFIDVPDEVLRLGDIVISYPQAREEAIEENKLIDEKIDELVVHGLMHLLGNNHE